MYAILNDNLDHKIEIRHVDKNYLSYARTTLYLDPKAANFNAIMTYLNSLETTPITSIKVYNDQDKMIFDVAHDMGKGSVLELSDRIEDLVISGNIERTVRLVVSYNHDTMTDLG